MVNLSKKTCYKYYLNIRVAKFSISMLTFLIPWAGLVWCNIVKVEKIMQYGFDIICFCYYILSLWSRFISLATFNILALPVVSSMSICWIVTLSHHLKITLACTAQAHNTWNILAKDDYFPKIYLPSIITMKI